MERSEFISAARLEVGRLQVLYGLEAWDIAIRVVKDETIPPNRAAEVSIQEPYRYARIELAESIVQGGSERSLMHIIEHEMQHILLHPLDALRDLVMDAVPDALRVIIANEFYRTGERLRAGVEHLSLRMEKQHRQRLEQERLSAQATPEANLSN